MVSTQASGELLEYDGLQDVKSLPVWMGAILSSNGRVSRYWEAQTTC